MTALAQRGDGPMESAPSDPADEADDPSAARANILIVDDLEENLLVYQTVLEDLNQTLVFARSGSQALKEVLRHEFAVILLDINMPDIDGFETASLVRRYRRSMHTPIIFLTSYADEMQTVRGYSLGAVDFILSPVVPDVLRTKVKVFVDLHRMQERVQRQADERAARMAAEAARVVAEQNHRRSTFLAKASRALGASLDVAVGERQLLDLVMPDLANLAVVLRMKEPGGLACRLYGWQGDDGGVHVEEAGAADRWVSHAEDLASAVAEARPRMFGAAWTTGFAAQVPGLPARRWTAALAVPLITARRCVGLILVCRDDRPPSDGWSADWSLLEELGERAAISLENAQLFQSLQAENSARIATEIQLQGVNRRKDEFLAMLSHELRNPLAPLLNALEVIRRVAPAHPKLLWASDVMGRQVLHMTRLIDELLDVARISEGKITLARVPVDLRAVIEAGVEASQSAIDARQHVLQVSLPETSIWLQGDSARLIQVVGNLLHNSAKYSSDGSSIELSLTAENGQAVISVRDTGIGIDAQLLPQIFELFIQGDRTLDRSQGGLGVGLTLVRRLVELHGGRVEAESAGPGQGAEFRVYLPVMASVPDAERAPGTPRRHPATRGLRVLIVDDNHDAAESVAQCLALEGHEVKTVPDGARTLASFPVFDPHVVLLDLGLPGMSGFEVARALRSRQTPSPLLLIAVTGYGQREDRQLAQEAGFDGHFVKPADPRQLVQFIDDWVSDRRPGTQAGGREAMTGAMPRSG